MLDELKKAWWIRSNQPFPTIRDTFIKKFEDISKSLEEKGVEVFKMFWTCLVDNGAVYATQLGVSKEEFLAWASESYDLYAAFVEESNGDPEQAHALRQRIFDEMNGKAG
jgi:hypothetical protein